MRKFLTLLIAFSVLGGMTATWAQSSGYNRLKNMATGHVANLESQYVFSPNVTMEQAASLPGTVAYIEFEDGTMSSLKAQNVDLVNVVIPTVKAMIPQMITEEVFVSLKDSVIGMVKTYMSGAMGTVLAGHLSRYSYDNFLDYVDNMDTNMYVESTDAGCYLYLNSPEFPINAGDLTTYFTNKVNGYLDLYRGTAQAMARTYLQGREQMIPMVNSMLSHFLFGDKLYLTEQEDEDYGTQFGFANTKDYLNSEVKALWDFVPVDDVNFFGVKGQYQDEAGNWWASLATSFPVRLPEGVNAYMVNDVVDPGKSLIKRVKVEQNIIPAMTPLVLELNGEKPEQNVMQMVYEEISTEEFDVNRLSLATDSLGFLLGKELPKIDRHYYVLGIMEGKVSLVETEETFLNPNDVYYYLSDELKSANLTGYLNLADDVDGINEVVNNAKADGKYYDMQGRVVNNPVRGLYIHNGKKVLVK